MNLKRSAAKFSFNMVVITSILILSFKLHSSCDFVSPKFLILFNVLLTVESSSFYSIVIAIFNVVATDVM